MRLHMVHRQRGNPPGHGQARPDRAADQQRADQTGPGRIGNGVELGARDIGFFQRELHQRQQFADMVPRGEFRNHATEAAVGLYLAI